MPLSCAKEVATGRKKMRKMQHLTVLVGVSLLGYRQVGTSRKKMQKIQPFGGIWLAEASEIGRSLCEMDVSTTLTPIAYLHFAIITR